MNMNEIWLPCKSFPGFIVNQEGLLMNTATGRILGKYINTKGAPAYKSRRISHFVADAWLGKKQPGFIVCHKNKNKFDNRPENLYYRESVPRIGESVKSSIEQPIVFTDVETFEVQLI